MNKAWIYLGATIGCTLAAGWYWHRSANSDQTSGSTLNEEFILTTDRPSLNARLPAPPTDKISRAVAAPLVNARDAIKLGYFDTAFEFLQMADAINNKTNFERMKITEFYWYATAHRGDHAVAAQYGEELIQYRDLDLNRREEVTRYLVHAYFHSKNYERLVYYGNLVAAQYPMNSERAREMVVYAYHLQDKCVEVNAAADEFIERQIADGRKVEMLIVSARIRCTFKLYGATEGRKVARNFYENPRYRKVISNSRRH